MKTVRKVSQARTLLDVAKQLAHEYLQSHLGALTVDVRATALVAEQDPVVEVAYRDTNELPKCYKIGTVVAFDRSTLWLDSCREVLWFELSPGEQVRLVEWAEDHEDKLIFTDSYVRSNLL